MAASTQAWLIFLTLLTGSASGEAAEERAKKKIMCSWLSFGQTRFICGEGNLADVKKSCDQKATQERGEPAECACTDDPQYIQNSCD